jgi:hypothetical membrane protein
MPVTWERVGAACGLAAPVVFLVLLIVAIAGDPDFVFFRDFLSDLGVGPAAWAFNSALIITGVLMVPFALMAVRPALGGGLAAGLAIGSTLVSAAFVILVGIFTEDYVDVHYLVSIGFFMTFLVALFFYSWTLHYSHALGRWMTDLTKVTFALGLVLTVLGFVPEIETLAMLAIVIWGLAAAIAIWRLETQTPTF